MIKRPPRKSGLTLKTTKAMVVYYMQPFSHFKWFSELTHSSSEAFTDLNPVNTLSKKNDLFKFLPYKILLISSESNFQISNFENALNETEDFSHGIIINYLLNHAQSFNSKLVKQFFRFAIQDREDYLTYIEGLQVRVC